MLSRVADSIYWMSRYIERAENVARFIDVNLNLMLDLPVGSTQQWQPLVDITGDTEEFEKRYGAATQQNVVQFLTFDPDNVNSIWSCFRAARENARSVRSKPSGLSTRRNSITHWLKCDGPDAPSKPSLAEKSRARNVPDCSRTCWCFRETKA